MTSYVRYVQFDGEQYGAPVFSADERQVAFLASEDGDGDDTRRPLELI